MKKVVLVDLDGVLVDLTGTWLHLYGEETQDWVHVDDITKYEFDEHVKDKEAFWYQLNCALRQAPPTRGSAAFRTLLKNENYDVYVVTYAHESNLDNFRTKLNWLKRYFPEFDQRKVIFTKHKERVSGDVLIEDNPANLMAWERENSGLLILINQPYNVAEVAAEVSRLNSFDLVPALLKGWWGV